MPKKILFLFLFLFSFLYPFAQTIDVQHYLFQIDLNDANDQINGKAEVAVKFIQPATTFALDLVQSKSNGKGMKVDSVLGKNVSGFAQTNDRLVIQLKMQTAANDVASFQIYYQGIPADGLIISKNKFGDRTFFADNWPNRAHHWIPCNDVPSDKATVEFDVTAPAHYQIISNGIQIEETNLGQNKKLTRWREDIPLPTKIMVIGAAQFAVERVDSSACLPVTAWVYPQNKQEGFYDYAQANAILQFYTGYIAPFPFLKLANVQSKTIFGGMENASAVFYTENSVTGTRESEDLLAHEIAHQWFGDMATEKSFAHLWLSEGFATYLTDVYWEAVHGEEAFKKRLQQERDKAVLFSHETRQPVVDSVSGLMDLLNANSYQKGAWVLHMLRNETGNSIFQQIIQTYYQQYKGRNADTKDFENVAEKVSGKNLKVFFQQWLYQPGIPNLKVQWKQSENKLFLTVKQTGKNNFQFPLEIGVEDAEKQQTVQKILVTQQATTFEFSVSKKILKVVLDPNTHLLFEGTTEEIK